MSGPRVVSLLPSATEVLASLGAEDLLVGRSHECDWPPSILDRPALTAQRQREPIAAANESRAIDETVRASLAAGQSLYTLDETLLAELAPDVILTQDLCEVCSIDLPTVERVAARLPSRPTVVQLHPTSLFDVLDDILRVGDAIGRPHAAMAAMVSLRDRYWRAVDFVNPFVRGPEVAFLEWLDPVFVGGHWTPELIEAAGGQHSLNRPRSKSRVATPEELLAAAPRRVIVAPCGWPLERIRAELPALTGQRWWPLLAAGLEEGPDAAVLVDGNAMFNRPGPRLVDAFEWLVGWINDRPELVPIDFPVLPFRA